MSLKHFNAATEAEATDLIRPCADIDGWVSAVVRARPFDSVEAVLAYARSAAASWSQADVAHALEHHPRIGERAAGNSTEAAMSRGEQSGMDRDAATAEALVDGNREYEARFGRVFLIRAAGRSAAEVLSELRRRLSNTDEAELAEVAEQLTEIALLRLEGSLRS